MCKTRRPVVYCHQDDAFLCRLCDYNVHAANTLAAKHKRQVLCEVCAKDIAVVRCEEDACMTCRACDEAMHPASDKERSRHQRLPLHSYVGDEYGHLLEHVSLSANMEEVEQYNVKYNQVKQQLMAGDERHGRLPARMEATTMAAPDPVSMGVNTTTTTYESTGYQGGRGPMTATTSKQLLTVKTGPGDHAAGDTRAKDVLDGADFDVTPTVPKKYTDYFNDAQLSTEEKDGFNMLPIDSAAPFDVSGSAVPAPTSTSTTSKDEFDRFIESFVGMEDFHTDEGLERMIDSLDYPLDFLDKVGGDTGIDDKACTTKRARGITAVHLRRGSDGNGEDLLVPDVMNEAKRVEAEGVEGTRRRRRSEGDVEIVTTAAAAAAAAAATTTTAAAAAAARSPGGRKDYVSARRGDGDDTARARREGDTMNDVEHQRQHQKQRRQQHVLTTTMAPAPPPPPVAPPLLFHEQKRRQQRQVHLQHQQQAHLQHQQYRQQQAQLQQQQQQQQQLQLQQQQRQQQQWQQQQQQHQQPAQPLLLSQNSELSGGGLMGSHLQPHPLLQPHPGQGFMQGMHPSPFLVVQAHNQVGGMDASMLQLMQQRQHITQQMLLHQQRLQHQHMPLPHQGGDAPYVRQPPSQMHTAQIASGGIAPGGPGNPIVAYAPGIQNVQTLEQEERKEKVRRYLEKKRSRKSDGKKTVRYLSRSRYAEARPRVRGRFVKFEPNASVKREDDDGAVGGNAGNEKEGAPPQYTVIDAATEVTTLSSELDSDMVQRPMPPSVAPPLSPKAHIVHKEEEKGEGV